MLFHLHILLLSRDTHTFELLYNLSSSQLLNFVQSKLNSFWGISLKQIPKQDLHTLCVTQVYIYEYMQFQINYYYSGAIVLTQLTHVYGGRAK